MSGMPLSCFQASLLLGSVLWASFGVRSGGVGLSELIVGWVASLILAGVASLILFSANDRSGSGRRWFILMLFGAALFAAYFLFFYLYRMTLGPLGEDYLFSLKFRVIYMVGSVFSFLLILSLTKMLAVFYRAMCILLGSALCSILFLLGLSI